MGYRVSTIKGVPSSLNCYFFLIGDYRNSSMANDLFRNGFNQIADRLGKNGGIIQSSENSNIEKELYDILRECMINEKQFIKYIEMYDRREPVLLIIWKHPTKLTKEDSVVIISFLALDETYKNSSELLLDLIAFAKKENNNLINKLKAKEKANRKLVKGLSASLNLGIISFNKEL